MTFDYDDRFYSSLATSAARSAEAVLPFVFELVSPKHIIDVGCGTGAWLRVASDLTGCDVTGVDGSRVPRDELAIPPETFLVRDLEAPLDIGQTFDLTMSMEVAEHLSASRAESFVRELTALAPAVLFGAAIPGQGGVGHVNEQWQSYWIGCFEQCGFQVCDVVRPAVWNDGSVASWYKQNLLLFVDPSVHPTPAGGQLTLVDVVHPATYAEALAHEPTLSLRRLVTLLPNTVKESVSHRRRELARTRES